VFSFGSVKPETVFKEDEDRPETLFFTATGVEGEQVLRLCSPVLLSMYYYAFAVLLLSSVFAGLLLPCR
jgi:hypothetical protein